MTRIRFRWTSSLAAAAMAVAARAAAFSGAEGASFLDIPVGGRPAAMGSAYSALATDSYAPIWNPAGLGALSQGEASLMHLSYLESMSYESIGAALPVGAAGGVGASLQYFRADKAAATDVLGNSGGDYSGYFLAAGLGYGQSLGKRFSVGAVGRVVTAQVAGIGASALAADVGAMGLVGSRLRLGAVLANLGSGLKFLQQADPLPAQLRLGAAMDVVPSLTLSLESVRAFKADDSVRAGLEWRLMQAIAVRAGYRSDVAREAGGMAGLTLGTGILWKAYSVDYAWVPMGDLGQTQYFSLAVRFGRQGGGPDRLGGGSIIVLP